jgi:hypothetical protein
MTSSAVESSVAHFEAERFGGLDVEHGFVFRRSLHREVGWFLAFQDAVDVGGGKPIQRGLINPEGDQSAFGDETARPIALQAYVFNVFGWLAEAARG